MVFCVAVVTLYSKLTGSENSVVGVTVLLAVLVLRQADLDQNHAWTAINRRYFWNTDRGTKA